MTGNNNGAKNLQNPLFDHPKNNYRIMERVIRQSEKAGFDAWHREKKQSFKSFAEYLLFFGPFTEEIFYHDFAARFFQNEKSWIHLDSRTARRHYRTSNLLAVAITEIPF
jgi:hypothetical protein